MKSTRLAAAIRKSKKVDFAEPSIQPDAVPLSPNIENVPPGVSYVSKNVNISTTYPWPTATSSIEDAPTKSHAISDEASNAITAKFQTMEAVMKEIKAAVAENGAGIKSLQVDQTLWKAMDIRLRRTFKIQQEVRTSISDVISDIQVLKEQAKPELLATTIADKLKDVLSTLHPPDQLEVSSSSALHSREPFLTVTHRNQTLNLTLSHAEEHAFWNSETCRGITGIVLKHYFLMVDLKKMTLTGQGKARNRKRGAALDGDDGDETEAATPSNQDSQQRKPLPTLHLMMCYAAWDKRFLISEGMKKDYPLDYAHQQSLQRAKVRFEIGKNFDYWRQFYNDNGTMKDSKRRKATCEEEEDDDFFDSEEEMRQEPDYINYEDFKEAPRSPLYVESQEM